LNAAGNHAIFNHAIFGLTSFDLLEQSSAGFAGITTGEVAAQFNHRDFGARSLEAVVRGRR
jgi:hypothetical protein